MARHGGPLEIVHAGAAEVAVGGVEAAGLDDVHRHAEAGAHADDGAGVLRDVGLEEREAGHGRINGSGPPPVKGDKGASPLPCEGLA